jgi:hypothetical protein
VGRAFYHPEIFSLHPVEFRFQGKLGHADDSIHRSADFMAHVREEFAFGAAV